MNARPVELSQSRATHNPTRFRPIATSGIASFKILASGRCKVCGLEAGTAQNPDAGGDCLMVIAAIEVRPGCFCFAVCSSYANTQNMRIGAYEFERESGAIS